MVAAALLGVGVSKAPQAKAANLYWDSDATAAGNNISNGTGLGGAGTWDTSSLEWFNGTDNVAWSNSALDIAFFTGTAGTVTLGGPITVGGLNFGGADFTVAGDTLTLAASSGAPSISVTNGNVATVSTTIAGTSGMTKIGNGVLKLTNPGNNYTGTTTISAGTLVVTSAGALGADTSAISILTANQVPSSTNLLGLGAGVLVLDGSAAGFSLSRNINFEGRGPLGDKAAAVLSIGDNTLSGALTSSVSPLLPATFRNSRINSINGTLTLSGTVTAQGAAATTFLSLGGSNTAGVGNFNLTGALAGSGSIEKSGAGVLLLNPSAASAFTGTFRVSGSGTGQQSSVRVTQAAVGGVSVFGANTGAGGSSAIDVNGGVLEMRSGGDLNFNALAGGKNVYLRANSTFFAGPALGGSTIDGLATFGTFRLASNVTGTFNSRNGYGMTFQAWTQESSANTNVITNNMGGVLTFTGNAWDNNDGTDRTLNLRGTGRSVITGSIDISGAGIKSLSKKGTGTWEIRGTATDIQGDVAIDNGALVINDFRSLNNNSGIIQVGSNASNSGLDSTNNNGAGSLIIGTTTAASAAGLTTSKVINLQGTTSGAAIYANQTIASPVILNANFTASGAGIKTLTLGGNNNADNIINGVIPDNSATNTTGLTKVGSGVWVLSALNTYTGATTIQNGTIKLRATAATSDVVGSTGAVVFGVDTVTQTAGGNLEFRGFLNTATTETLGALTLTAGAATITLLGNDTGKADLAFTSLAATTLAGSVNFVTTGANGGSVTLTGQAATTGTNLPGTANFQGRLYINGADFAITNASAQVVAPVYGATGDFREASTALVSALHNKLTGSFTNAAATVSSLVTNSQTLTLSGNLVVSTGGILQSGGTATIQSNGTTARTIAGAAAVNMAIRVDLGSDVLNFGTSSAPVILPSATTGGFTKSGAGTLVFFGANAQTGATNINEGVVRLSGSASKLSGSAGLTVRQGAKLELDGTVNPTYSDLIGAGTVTNINASAVAFQTNGSGNWSGLLTQASGAGALSVVKGGTIGAPTWSNQNTYTGSTTISGSTGSVTVDWLADGGTASGIGASSSDAANLVFSASGLAGLIYRGSIISGSLTLGSRSASTDRLFTLSGPSVLIKSDVTNNNALVWSNTGAIVHGTVAARTLTLGGSSTGDNTFNPQLTDSGTAANITGLTKSDAGQWNLGNSNNTYTGRTSVQQGILALNNAGALPANSPLVLGDAANSGTIQASGVFARNLVDSAGIVNGVGTITFGGTTGGGGFAAHAAPLTVTLSNNAPLTWGAGGFVGTGGAQTLFFGSASALSDVTLTNPISFGAAKRTINVVENSSTGADFATLSGVLSGDSGIGFQKAGNSPLRLTGANIYTGVTDINAGTLIVTSLGSSTGGATSSVGAGGVAMDNTNAVTIGNASTGNGQLQYVGPGETSNRKIRINATTGSSAGAQILADGSGPLILTNVANDMVTDAGSKNLWLRGSSPYVNQITSVLADNGGALAINVDGGTAWVLTNSGNTYTGTTSASGGALGVGHDSALGGSTLSVNNGNVFAHGGDRALTNALSLVANASNGWIGDYSLTFNGANTLAGTGSSSINITTYNGIRSGKKLTLAGMTSAATGNRAWGIDGPGETVLTGNYTTSTAFWFRIDKYGDGTLVLGTSGSGSNWNSVGSSVAAVDVDRGTLRFSVNEAIPSTAASGGLIISPEIATTDTSTVDLNGTTQTINSLTATTDGTVRIDNTSSGAASFRFGANNAAVSFGAGVGTYLIENTGAGELGLVKLGNSAVTFGTGVAVGNKGELASEGGGSLTIAGQVTAASGLRAIGASTLALTGGITNPGLMRSVEVGAGSTLTLLDGAGSNFNGLTALRLGNTGTGTAILNLNVGTGATDTLSLAAGGTLALGASVTFNLTDAGLDENTAYTLLNLADGGITAFGAANMVQGAMPGGFDAITWSVDNNQVRIITGNLITGILYWRGLTNSAWNGNANNWSTDKAGSLASTSFPGAGTDVVFSHNGASGALVTTLEQNYRVNSLTFEPGTTTPTSVTINTGANASSRLEVSDYITLAAGAPASVTLGGAYKIGGAQTWTVADAAAALTFGGVILGNADVTKAGAGKVVLAVAADATFNASQGFDLIVNAGAFEIQNVASLGSLANDNLARIALNGGSFYLANATAGTVPNPITLAGGALSASLNGHTYSGAIAVTSASVINMADANGPAANTARNITLSGPVTGSGSLTVDSNNTASSGNQLGGTLTISNAASAWSGALIMNRGTVTVGSAASPYWAAKDVTFASFGRLILQGVNAQNITRTGAFNLAAGAVAEFQVDNVSGTLGTDFVVDQSVATNLGAGSALRVYLNDSASKMTMAGVVLSGAGSISLGGDGAGVLTLSGVISESGGSFGLALNDDAGGWATANRLIRLTASNTFTGPLTVGDGTVDFSTVSNIGGGASNLGQGSSISMLGGVLRFVGGTSQSTDRSLVFAGNGTVSAAGTSGAVLTLSGTIDVSARTADGSAFTLSGSAGSAGVITSAISITGDSADLTVNGGNWSLRTATSRIGDELTVTGSGTILNLDSGLVQVRDDLYVANDAVLNLNASGVLSFNTATLSGDASLRVYTGATLVLGANNAIVATEFDGLRIGTDNTGIGYMNTGTYAQGVSEFILGNRNLDRSGVVSGTGVITVSSNLDLYNGTFAAGFAAAGSLSMDKLSMNTVTISGSAAGMTGTGATSIYEGTLILDYASDVTTKLIVGGALDMRGAGLVLKGNAASSVSQSVASFTLGNGGSNTISFQPVGGNGIVLSLNALTRAINAQDGTLRITLPAGSQGATNGVTTDTLNTLGAGANAILGGWLTVDDGTGVYFAKNTTNAADGNIVAAATTARDAVSAWVSGENITDASGFSGTVSLAAPNSLRFNATSGSDLVLASSGVVGVGSGGLLVTSNVGGTPSLANGTLFSAATASNVPELIFIQDSAQSFEVSADILANHALTKTGNGVLQLSGQNRYSGITEIQNGTLRVNGGNAIGDASVVVLSASRPSTFQLLADETIGRLAGGSRQTDQDLGVVAVGANTLTINHFSSSAATYDGIFTGTGSIVRNGTSGIGNFLIRGVSGSGFTGSLVLNGGLTYLEASGTLGASSITINRGASFLISNNGSTRSGTRLPDTMPMFLNSADGSWNGETRPSGLVIRTDQNATTNETIGVLTLASGSSYFRGDASGTTGIAGLITANIVRSNASTFTVRGRNLGLAAGNRNFLRIVSGTTEETAFAATLVGGGGAAAAKNISIVPWAIGETLDGGVGDSTMGNTLVTYVATSGSGYGLRPLDLTTEYQTFATKATNADNVRVSLSADLTGLAGQTVNALVINNSNTSAASFSVSGSGADQILTVTSGAMLFTATAALTGSPSMGLTLGGFNGGISVGATNEYVVFVQNPTSAPAGATVTATIASPLITAADLTKSGRGILVLSGTNTAGGGARRTTLNEGILQVGDLDNIGGNTGALVFAGGTLRLGAGFADDLSQRTISFLSGGGSIDTNGVDLVLAGSLGAGAGGFTKLGTGNLTLNAAASFTGGATLSAGTITLGANDALGVGGSLTINAGATLDIGSRSLTVSTLTTAGASPVITGTGVITASQGFSFGQTTDLAIAAVLAGPLGLSKSQSSVLTLTGANTYAGTTEVTAGTLVFDSIANVGGGASSLGAPTNAENGVIRMGLTTNGAGLRYTGSGHSTDRAIGLQGTTGTISVFANGTGALALNSGARFEMAGNKTFTLRGTSDAALANSIGALTELGGVMTLNKADANTWVLASANAYTGATQVDDGTIRLGVSDALPVTTALRLGTGATAGTLDLNGFNQTVGSLTVQTNNNLVNNSILVASGRSLTINGAVSVGVNVNESDTNFSVAGGGSLVVNSNNGNFQIGAATVDNENRVDVDFSGLASFTANLGTGVFRLGDPNTGTGNSTSTLRLAPTSTITAATLRIGDGTGGSQVHVLTLGSVSNVLNADTINVGSAGSALRSSGSIIFDPSDVTGMLTLRAANGSGRATLNLVNTSGNTAGDISGSMTLAGHSVDLYVGTLTMGARSVGSGAATGMLTFDQGTLDVSALVLASRTGAGTGNGSATLSIGGGSVDIDGVNMAVNTSAGGTVSAVFNVAGGSVSLGTGTGTALNMANAGSGRSATASLSITGGTLSLAGNIVRSGGAGTESATITLNGGIMNVNGFAIGEASKEITFTAQSGTLRNIGALNGTGGLTKTGVDTLILDGTAAYVGITTISAGTLQVGAGGTTGALGAAAIVNNGTLAISRSDAFAIGVGISGSGGLTKLAAGNLTLSGANDFTGATLVSAGSLTATSGALSATSGITVNGAVLSAVNYNLAATLALDASATATISAADLTISGAVTNAGTTAAALNFSASTGKITLASLAGAGKTRFGAAADITGGVSEGDVTVVGALGANITGGTVTAGSITGNVSAGTVTAATLTGNISGGAVTLTGLLTGNVTAGTVTAGSMTGDVGSSVTISGALNGAITAGTNSLGSLTSSSVTGGTNTITGAATVTTVGGGTTTVGGVATITTLTTGTLNLNGATASVGTLNGGTINLGSTALTVNEGTFAGLLAGANGSLIKATSGALTITGANTFGGGTSVNAGTLTLGDASALGTGAITVASGAFLDLAGLSVSNVITAVDAASILNGPTTAGVTTAGSTSVTTVLTGPGGLTKTDGGELTLTTPNFFTGAVEATTAGAVISAAHLADNSSSLGASALNDPTKLVLGNGATLEFTGTTATTTSRSFTVNGAAALAVDAAAAPLTFSSASIMALDASDPTPELKLVANNSGVNRFESQISAADLAAGRGLANLVIDGTGKWVLGGSANRFKGDARMDVAGGATLGFESGALGTNATHALSVIEVANGSRLAWSGANTDDISSRLSVPAGATAKLDLGANTVTFASNPNFGAGASLQKEGSGALKIAAAVNAPTVNVAVSSGLLAVNGTLGDITLSSGAKLGGSGTVTNATLVSGAILSPGNSPGVFNATNVVLPGGSIMEWQVQDATDHVAGYDKLNITGNLDLRGASAGNRVVLRVVSLLGAGDGTALGDPLNFGPPNGVASIRTFAFATVGGVQLNNGVNISDVFTFDLAGFTYSDGSASNAALWSIDFDGVSAITLTAVPEPSTYGFAMGALALAAAAIRRRRKTNAESKA
ncbi:MAG: hypothetical protein RL444_610 [Verrucomicrobiota bacterium]|jgi:autotransporter-associated beta strand protein